MKFSKVPCDMSSYSGNDDGNLIKVKIVVMHEKKNRNMTSFSMDAIERAKETVKNIPILAYILRDTEGNVSDFDEHNMEMRLKDSKEGFSIETYYHEKPIGVVPESCNPRYEEINGVNHLVVDGYIWKSYSNGADKILMSSESKGLSMEIEVIDGDYNEVDDVYDITNFRFLGVTCLGDHVEQGMNGTASISRYSMSADYKEALADIYKEIYSLERKEADQVEDVAKDEVVVEEVEITEEPTVEEVTEKVVENEETIEGADNDGEVQEEKEEVVEDVVEEQAEEVIETVEVVETNEFSLDVFSALLDEVPDTLEEVVMKIAEKFNALNEEVEKLSKFKAEKDLEVLKDNVEEVSNRFNLDVDLTELKNKVYSNEMTLEGFEKELKVMFADKMLEDKKNFSANKKEVAKIVVTDNKVDEPKKSVYGGILDRF